MRERYSDQPTSGARSEAIDADALMRRYRLMFGVIIGAGFVLAAFEFLRLLFF